MDYYNTGVQGGVESMDIAYVRYGQAQEPLSTQFSGHSQYSSSTAPAPQYRSTAQAPAYRSTASFSPRGHYKPQSQYSNSVQYEEPETALQYDDGSEYDRAQYDDGSQYEEERRYPESTQYDSGAQYGGYESTGSNYNKSNSSQYSTKTGGSWQQSKKHFQEPSNYGQSNSPTLGSRGYATRNYVGRGATAYVADTYKDTYNKDTYNKGAKRGRGSVATATATATATAAAAVEPSTYVQRGRSTLNTNSYGSDDKFMKGGVKAFKEPVQAQPRIKIFQRTDTVAVAAAATTASRGRSMLPSNTTSYDKLQSKAAPLMLPAKKTTAAAAAARYTPSQAINSSSPFSARKRVISNPHSGFMGTSSGRFQDGGAGDQMKIENGGKKVPWMSGGIRKKKKKTPAEKNLRLKKYVQPKNAVMCLNELVQGIVYTVEEEAVTSGTPICVSVEVNGQKYRGFGSSKQIAKQAAAEAALVSFVKPPNPSNPDDNSEDNTPWAVLACFAMYKLFNEWREGRIGMCHPGPFGIPLVQDATMSQSKTLLALQSILGRSMPTDDDKMVAGIPARQVAAAAAAAKAAKASNDSNNVFAAYLGCKDGGKDDPKTVPNPARALPDNAISMHPVMLLHQMRPTLIYGQSQVPQKGGSGDQHFKVTCNIDNQNFTGEGANVKKAKLDLAFKANKVLFGIDSTYQAN